MFAIAQIVCTKVLRMENEYLKKAKEHALSKRTEEICGLIIENEKKDLIYYKCKNISSKKNNNFAIDPLDYLKAKNHGKIKFCFHSHIKDSSFSYKDIQNAFKHNIAYILYNIKQDRFYFFDPNENKKYQKYLNLPYENGVQDCHILLKNFYFNELGLDIHIKNTPERVGVKYEDLKRNHEHVWSLEKYKDEYIRNGFDIFFPKNIEDLKIFDVLVFSGFEKGIPTHGALFLENEMILHQRYNFISTLESLRKAHFRYIIYGLRHKTFLK